MRGSKQKLLIAAGVIVLMSLSVWIYNAVQPRTPIIDAVQHLSQLQSTISNFDASLSNQTPTDTVTQSYLSYLTTIQSHCRDIRSVEQDGGLSVNQKTTLRPSIELCIELATLAQHSGLYYKPLQSILSQNTTVQRYQTFTPIANFIRTRNISALHAALKQIAQITPYANAYPTQIPTLTAQLDKNIRITKDLGYMPALQRYQLQVLAERQQYWTTYADLADLKRELTVQISHLCHASAVGAYHDLCSTSKS